MRGYFKMFAASESACFPERNVCEPGLFVFVVKFIIFYVTALTMMCFK